jgi:hypothetical protein
MNVAATLGQWNQQREAVLVTMLRKGGKVGVWTPAVTTTRSGLATMPAGNR